MSAQPPHAVNALLANVCHVVQSVVSSPPESTHPRADVFHFFNREGRLPRIGDERAPWTYCGWMLPYVISLHGHPLFDCPDRWGYHLRTIAAGELLDQPIPRIEFCGEFEPSVRRIWEGAREGIAGSCHILNQTDGYSWDSFKHLVDWLAFALSVEKEPPPIRTNPNEALYRTVNIEPLLLQPCDYLGAALNSDRKKPAGCTTLDEFLGYFAAHVKSQNTNEQSIVTVTL